MKKTSQQGRPRGQLSLELVLAGALLAAAVLLASNYASAIGSSTRQSSGLVQAQLIAGQVARVANAACVSGASVSLEVECPSSGFAEIGGTGDRVTANAGGGTAGERTACGISRGVVLDCAGTGRRWLCIANGANGAITLSEGRCA